MFSKLLQKLSLLGHFWQEKGNFSIFRWNLLFIGLQIILLIFKFKNLPLQVPLFYSMPWGEQQLASNTQIIYLPILSVIITIINGFWAALLVKSNQLFSKLLIIFSSLFSLFAFYTLYQIISLVS